jgi:hypothetical protein
LGPTWNRITEIAPQVFKIGSRLLYKMFKAGSPGIVSDPGQFTKTGQSGGGKQKTCHKAGLQWEISPFMPPKNRAVVEY